MNILRKLVVIRKSVPPEIIIHKPDPLARGMLPKRTGRLRVFIMNQRVDHIRCHRRILMQMRLGVVHHRPERFIRSQRIPLLPGIDESPIGIRGCHPKHIVQPAFLHRPPGPADVIRFKQMNRIRKPYVRVLSRLAHPQRTIVRFTHIHRPLNRFLRVHIPILMKRDHGLLVIAVERMIFKTAVVVAPAVPGNINDIVWIDRTDRLG